MGRRRKFLRPGPLTWVLVFLAVATLPSAAQAGSEHPQLVTQAHEEKPFRIDVPEGWSVEWDYPLGPYRKANMVAFGPMEHSIPTNVGVTSKWAEVEETDDYLLEAGHQVIEAVQRSDAATIMRPSTVVETSNSRAAVFVIVYEGLPVSQVIALVASQSLSRVWTIVGTSALETAERNEPTFQAVIASFEILTDPSPAYIGPVGPPLALLAFAGSAALLGVWVLYRRRHQFIPLLRTLRDEGRIPGQFGVPPEGVETFEGSSETPEDRR